MKNKALLINFLLILSVCLFFVCMMMVDRPSTAHAQEQEYTEIVSLSTGNNDESYDRLLISGTNERNQFITATIDEFTGVKYIPNANYFLINPRHSENNTSDNAAGTCTTVAMQMLMGYHNYYSDRRIIPATGNGRTFLAEEYGNIEGHPAFERRTMPVIGADNRGCKQIGTEDGVYQELYDLTWFSDLYVIGQAVGLVKDGAVRFVNEYTPQAAKGGISITSGSFSKSEAQSDIDAGRPIILGMNGIFGDSQDNFHIVVAYGYATLDNVDGFLVHYGWGDTATQVWVPSSWFWSQIRMSVAHNHEFYDTCTIVKNTHRKLSCSVCGYSTPDLLYNITDSVITSNKYQLSGDIVLPDPLKIYSPSTASFTNLVITGIGDNAFANQINITNIYIPSSVLQLGDSAFEGCVNLNSITFGVESVLNNVGNNTFANCTSLESIMFPYGVTTIGNGVFVGCTSLTDLILPESITSIGNNAFECCTSLQWIILPNRVTSIGKSLFKGCSGLISVLMSSDVESIGDSAFAYCESLKNFTIPSPVTEIGSRAFEHCESLQSITIPSKVQWIGNYCFSNCTGLTEVVFGRASELTSIGNSAFEDCTSLESIDIPKGIQYIYNVTFCNCSALTSIKIPSSVGYVANNAFVGCDALATVYYGDEPDNESEGEVTEGDWNNISIGVNNSSLISARKYYYRSGQPEVYGYFWHYEGNTLQKWPFYGLRYTLINNGTEYEISKAGNLEGEITIPSTYNEKPVTRIARWGFANSLDITGIIIPESISMLYGSSFANCPNIKSITVNSANKVYMDGYGKNCIITRKTQILVVGCKNSVLPGGLVQIGSYAFAGCSDLTNITIPSSVVTIGESAFEDCRGLTSFIMQSGLQTIGNNALKNCSGITNVSIPDSVTSIGNYAFYGLGFTSVTVPGGVLSIGQNAFGGNNLTAINVDTGNTCYYSHGGVLFGAEGVLLSCPSAKSGNYDIPDGTTEIGDYAFYGCWQLTGITIINNVTSIGEYAFWGCTQLAYITISADSVLESIGSSAFFECFGVSEITIPQSVTFIGATAFGDWTEDQTIVMNVDVSFVWQWDVDWALQCYAQINWGGNSAIATEGLQYTLTNVGYEVSVGSSLSDNDNNGTVVIPAVYNGYPVVGVAEFGFFDCQGLVKVMFIGNNLMYIGNNAFAGCSNLTAINIPHGVTHIGQEAFCSCIQLQSINLPQTIEEIYCTAFKECDNLKSIMIQGGLTYIEVDTFDEINEYTIYTENGSDNPEWHFINFSPSCVVFYNCTFSVDGAFVVSILVQGENYVNANPTAPCREGYVFAGWTTTLGGDVEYDMEDAVSGAISDTVLYAVWEPVGE